MKFSTQDFPRIRGSLIVLVSALALGTAVVYGSNKLLKEARQSRAVADRERAEATGKLERVKLEQEDLQGYYQQYQVLVARDVIGPERRLDWIDAIEKIRGQQNVFSVKYNLGPQKTLSVATPASGGFNLNLTGMTLDFSLLHEEQLLDFLDALRAEAKGMYLLERCNFTRIGLAQEIKFAPNLRAECSLGWITLNDKTAEVKK